MSAFAFALTFPLLSSLGTKRLRRRARRRNGNHMYNAEMGCHCVGDIPFLMRPFVPSIPITFSSPVPPSIPQFPLPFLAFKEGLDIRPQAARHCFDHVIGIGCVIDGFLFSCHALTGFRAASQPGMPHACPDPECPSESDPTALSDLW